MNERAVVEQLEALLSAEPDRTLTIRQPDGANFAVTDPDVARRRSPIRARRRTAA